MMEEIRFNFPFQKVNKDKRIVTGIATAENIDQSGDIVDFQGSLTAFKSWVGNIREMHGREAVGKAVSYNPTTVEYQGKRYPAIEVNAYISKGAPNTWEKVLDGTLRGFSIGGHIVEKGSMSIDGMDHRVIKSYVLGELSLVDNPDNPAALISMIKMADNGTLELEMEKDGFTIFYCDEHKVIKANTQECDFCEIPMVSLGFVDEFNVDEIDKMIAEFDIAKVNYGHKSPPKGQSTNPDDYADPTNWKWEIDEPNIDAAYRYYNQSDMQSTGGYTDAEWASVGRRIVARLNQYRDGNYRLVDGKIVDTEKKTSEFDSLGDSESGCIECGIECSDDFCESCEAVIIAEDVEKAEGFVPPQGVRDAAARGLALRDEYNRGGTMVGVARARDLSNGRAVSLSTIRRMVSYFARHEVDKQGQGWNAGEDGYPSAGKIAWLLWGGDSGRSWANKISNQQKNKEGNMSKDIDLQNNESTDSVATMELSADQKVSMIHKFISWLGFSDDEAIAKAVSETVEVEETEVVAEEVTEDEVVEKDGGSEVDITELTTAISSLLDEKLSKAHAEMEASLEAKIDEKIEAVTKSVADVTDKVESISTSVTEVSEKVETIDEATAVRKSVDKTDDEVEVVEKTAAASFWGNIFVPQEIVQVLGYES